MYPVVTDGKQFVEELLKEGALALWAPAEGGFEGNYRRRVREAGYISLSMSARGLGDPARYLTELHSVRPAHLGKREKYTYTFPPVVEMHLANLPPKSKGLLLWIIEAKVMAQQELEYLMELTQAESRLKIVVEVGSEARKVRWQALTAYLGERAG